VAPYCTVDTLEAYLGRVLTDGESDGADAACLAATDWIDNYTGLSWQSGTITGEVHTVNGPMLALDFPPLTAITSITARGTYVGATVKTLVAGRDYDVLDAANGLLVLNQTDGDTLTVSYTRPVTVPASITQAANIIAAGYLVGASATNTRAAGLTELSAGSVTLKWQLSSDAQASIPAEAQALLAPYRSLAYFA
jgi:hypothetical protein